MSSFMDPEWFGIQIKTDNSSRSRVLLMCARSVCTACVCTAVCVHCGVCALRCVCTAVCVHCSVCVHCGVRALQCVCTAVCLHQNLPSFQRFEMYAGSQHSLSYGLFRPQQPHGARLDQTAPKCWMRSFPEISC